MPVTGAFPYDVNHLLGGAGRVLFTDDTSVAIPTKLSDVIDLESPYAAQTGWIDFGATKESANYEREIESEGYEIQQTTGVVLEEITDVARTLEVSIAEVKPEHLQILEESADVDTIAAVSGTNTAQKAVKFGSISDLTRRRICLIGRRSRQSGEVEETGGLLRGRFVAVCFYNATIAADSSEVSFEKGELVELPVTFQTFPEDGELAGEEVGVWLEEEAGEITP